MTAPQDPFAANVARSAANLSEAQRRIEAAAMTDHALEAAAQAEDLIRWVTQDWAGRGFTPEQCVFALALATINFREGVPETFGGKTMFDRVAAEAKKYYDANQ